MIRLSYIVPCYNVERYIKDCIDSIYNQSLSEECFEVLCIDDNSDDSTYSILVSLAQNHKNLRLFKHSVNLTAGGARNTGIENSQGEYIWFIDPDDILKPDSTLEILHIAEQNNTDILFFNNDVVNEDGDYIKSEKVFTNTYPLSGPSFITTYFDGRLSKIGIVWRGLFRKDFLLSNRLKFPEIKKSQDVIFCWDAIIHAQVICACDLAPYLYRQNPNSIANQRKKGIVLFSEHILFPYHIQLLILSIPDVNDSIVKDMRKTILWGVNSTLYDLKNIPSKEQFTFFHLLNENTEKIQVLKPFLNKKHRILFSPLGGEMGWKIKLKWL